MTNFVPGEETEDEIKHYCGGGYIVGPPRPGEGSEYTAARLSGRGIFGAYRCPDRSS